MANTGGTASDCQAGYFCPTPAQQIPCNATMEVGGKVQYVVCEARSTAQQACPLRMPLMHQALDGAGVVSGGGDGGGDDGRTHTVSAAVAHSGARLSTRPEQHWSRPPGALPQPPPGVEEANAS